MQMSAAVKATIRAVADRFPIPSGAPGDGKERAAREWIYQLAEQLAFSHGMGWGTKSAGGGRPPSKDVVAYWDGSTLWGFDILTGVGEFNTRLTLPDQGKNLTVPLPENEFTAPQDFIAVAAKNHLGAPPVEEPTPTDPGTPLPAGVEALLREFVAEQRAFNAYVRERLR